MVRMKRRLMAVGIALGLVAVVSAEAMADKIRMSSRSSNWDIVLIESGVAEKYGFELEVVPMKTGVEVAEALVSGSVDCRRRGQPSGLTSTR